MVTVPSSTSGAGAGASEATAGVVSALRVA